TASQALALGRERVLVKPWSGCWLAILTLCCNFTAQLTRETEAVRAKALQQTAPHPEQDQELDLSRFLRGRLSS
ncbi:MAG: hypothetical protein WCR59_10270, partial [Planctomycetota bacterium]